MSYESVAHTFGISEVTARELLDLVDDGSISMNGDDITWIDFQVSRLFILPKLMDSVRLTAKILGGTADEVIVRLNSFRENDDVG